ncbi:MAG: histidine kinase [Bacteroidia bacterium]|nr:histidine kinase [Bacteroidia bacterium]
MKNILLLCLFLFSLNPASAYDGIIYPDKRVQMQGDNPLWASKDLNDESWVDQDIDGYGYFWVRFSFEVDEEIFELKHPGLHIISLGSYEVYWDGVKIGENGKVGETVEEEVPGNFMSQVLIPDSLATIGSHIVAFRVSNVHMPTYILGSWNACYIEEYKQTVEEYLRVTAFIFILAGIYLMAGTYYLFLFIMRNREKEELIFSLLCFLFFGLIFAEYFKFLYLYPYPFHIKRLGVIYFLTLFISFLTPYFFVNFFELPKALLINLTILVLLIASSFILTVGTDPAARVMSLVGLISSLGIAFYAVYKKKQHAWVVFSALSISGMVILFYQLSFRFLLYAYDVTLFISFSILVLSMMYVLARRARDQKEAYEASVILSSRLQNELLKKNIQPHFIMNTLTSLMEWIEEAPGESIQFIEALSGEFEIMSEIAEEKLIPIMQEIDLCKYHIEIMRFRKELNYIFIQENIDPEEKIPPAIFHTLIENAITHSYPDKENRIKIFLRFFRVEDHRYYELEVVARNKKTEKKEEGTGFKYIRSRLSESYGEQWTLDSSPTESGWITRIKLLNA